METRRFKGPREKQPQISLHCPKWQQPCWELINSWAQKGNLWGIFKEGVTYLCSWFLLTLEKCSQIPSLVSLFLSRKMIFNKKKPSMPGSPQIETQEITTVWLTMICFFPFNWYFHWKRCFSGRDVTFTSYSLFSVCPSSATSNPSRGPHHQHYPNPPSPQPASHPDPGTPSWSSSPHTAWPPAPAPPPVTETLPTQVWIDSPSSSPFPTTHGK